MVEFGGLARLTEECRDARRVNWIQDLGQDIGYGLRMLRKNPGFTAVAILTLALGIGANTAIFSVLDAVILRPLPYPAADRLVLIWTDLTSAGTSDAPFSGPDMADVRARSHLLADVGGIWVGRAALTGTGEPEQVKLGFVTDNFLTIVGVHPAMGRLFVAQDNVQGAAPVVILSDGLWRRRFGASVEIVGQTVRLDGSPATVIGVMPENFRLMFPAGFHVPPDVQVWTPFRRDVAHDPRDLNFLRVLGRLRPDATIAATREEMHAIAGQLRKEYVVDSKQGEDFGVAPLQKVTTREITAGAARAVWRSGIGAVDCVRERGESAVVARGVAETRGGAAIGAGSYARQIVPAAFDGELAAFDFSAGRWGCYSVGGGRPGCWRYGRSRWCWWNRLG